MRPTALPAVRYSLQRPTCCRSPRAGAGVPPCRRVANRRLPGPLPRAPCGHIHSHPTFGAPLTELLLPATGTLGWTVWPAASLFPAPPHSSPPRCGASVQGCCGARTVAALEAVCPEPGPAKQTIAPLFRLSGRQVVADTVIFGPLHVAGYFTHMTLSEGGGLPDVAAKLRTDFWPTFSAELFVWPVVQVSPVPRSRLVVVHAAGGRAKRQQCSTAGCRACKWSTGGHARSC